VDVTLKELPLNGNFSYIHKVREGTHIYFFANSGETVLHPEILVRGKLEPLFLDPHTGEEAPVEYEHMDEHDQAYTRIRLSLGPVQSVFIVGQE
jgi:hypothetical protein